jgi:hypothetical protein
LRAKCVKAIVVSRSGDGASLGDKAESLTFQNPAANRGPACDSDAKFKVGVKVVNGSGAGVCRFHIWQAVAGMVIST